MEMQLVLALIVVFMVTGTVGNSLVVAVYCRPRARVAVAAAGRSPAALFILVLAGVDLTTSLFIMPWTAYMEYNHFQIPSDLMCKLYHFLITSNIPFSAFIMVVIAADRYLVICHPLKHILTQARAKVICAVMATLAGCSGVTVALMFGTDDNGLGVSSSNMTSSYGSPNLSAGYSNGSMNSVGTYEANSSQGFVVGGNVKNVVGNVSYGVTQVCKPNGKIISQTFMQYYQQFYSGMFLICLVIVIFLYALIFKAVVKRHSKLFRARRKSSVFLTDTFDSEKCVTTQDTILSDGGGRYIDTRKASYSHTLTGIVRKYSITCKTINVRLQVANMRIAGMLFVVTLVFILTYLPAFLMMMHVVPFNGIIFYLYFGNNVANPIIYSLMNSNFRTQLKKLFRNN